MSQPDLISVVMPVFNGERYLKDAVESILNQSYVHFEFIIINDGSTDSTTTILSQFKDDRLKLVQFEENRGLVEALNHGFKLAQGNYIARMDADDVALPNRLLEQLKAMKQHPEWIACDTDYFLYDGIKKIRSSSSLSGDELKVLLIFSTCFSHPSVMMKRSNDFPLPIYEKAFKHVEDYRLWTQLAPLGQLGHLSVPLLLYRHHDGQISNNQRDTQLALNKQIRIDYLNHLGISLSETEWLSLNRVGNNEFITSVAELMAIEQCLSNLKEKLITKTHITPSAIVNVINKFWYDSCGFTNLGWKAFTMYRHSNLANGAKTARSKWCLLLKCLIRAVK